MSVETPEKLLLSAVETAALLNISRTSLYALHSSGRLPLPVHLLRRTLWNFEELKAWTAAGCPARQKWEALKGISR
jgi:predicted DNA-binding transcriptional regulator AlpA